MKTSGYLDLYWTDELLKWEPSEHGNISYILLPQDEIWKPTIALYNSVVSHKAIGDPDLLLPVTDRGDVIWYPFQVFFLSTKSYHFLETDWRPDFVLAITIEVLHNLITLINDWWTDWGLPVTNNAEVYWYPFQVH